ncbi:MAG: aryl-sulfate sulfotransferase [Beijerinckiaceae bacterium]
MEQTTWQRIVRTGFIDSDIAKACEGYVLFTPHNSSSFTVLIDGRGNEVRRWAHEGMRGGYTSLLKNGNIHYDARPAGNVNHLGPVFSNFRGGAIQELDRDGKIVWECNDPSHHHDSKRRREGGLMRIAAERMPQEYARKLAPDWEGPIYADVVISSEPDGTEIWRWRSWEHFDLEDPKNRFRRGPGLWMHLNAIELGGDGTFTVSARYFHSVMVIDRHTGAVRERYSPATTGTAIYGQHDPRLLPNGNILIFDNGWERPDSHAYSRVVEFERGSGKIVWSYEDKPRTSFFSSYISGVDPCPYGNVLVCEGQTGRLFQVTRDGEVVWEYINPHFAESAGVFDNTVYRARFYMHDQVAHLL